VSLNAWVCAAVNEKLDCNRLSDRFDGVIDRKNDEFLMLHAIQSMEHRRPIFSPTVVSSAFFQEVHVTDPKTVRTISGLSSERAWGKMHG
jgi:hypothetical protein